jgi:ATP-dependent Clp protease ATP-binding subunit ClpC
MFERFNDRARRVLVLTQEEARLLNHDVIGTEHLLLGLIHEQRGIPAQVLTTLGITAERARNQVELVVGIAVGEPSGSAPFSPRVKKVLELSLREALQNNHNYIGPEHLLLGLVTEGQGTGARVIQELGVELSQVRQAVLQEMSDYHEKPGADEASGELESSDAPRCAGCSGDLELALRYRSMTIPPTSPDPFPLKVDVIYCNRCGRVVSILRTESSG